MQWLNKHASKLIDKGLQRKDREYYAKIEQFNIDAAILHRTLAQKIDLSTYTAITNYVNQYIAHTTIWNVKFYVNMQNLEVATMQLIHLEAIFANEHESLLSERNQFAELQQLFSTLSDYALTQYELHVSRLPALKNDEL